MTQNANNLCWLDMEMTGLNPEHDRIIEVAMIITDSDLNVLAQSDVYVIHQSDELLNGMDEWNTATHGRTGLTQRVRESKLTEAEVEQNLLDFMSAWIPEKSTPMCGNSIHQDRRFMVKYMPRFGSLFPLPQLRRIHSERIGQTLESGRRQKRDQTRFAQGIGRHPRKHRRNAPLSRAFPQTPFRTIIPRPSETGLTPFRRPHRLPSSHENHQNLYLRFLAHARRA